MEMPKVGSYWSNRDNAKFYEEISFEGLYDVAYMSGLDTCCDVALIEKYLSPQQTILDVGAGYGRVFDYLIPKGFSKLYAIERSKNFCSFLHDKFKNTAQIFKLDLCTLESAPLNMSFDTILFLGASLIEFSKDEQPYVLQSLMSLVKPGGNLIIDNVPRLEGIHRAIDIERKNGKNLNYNYFIPSSSNMASYGRKLGLTFADTTTLKYRTITSRPRYLHIFPKSVANK